MTNDNEAKTDRKLNGCGWIAIGLMLAFSAAVLYVLFMFGSWIGQQ